MSCKRVVHILAIFSTLSFSIGKSQAQTHSKYSIVLNPIVIAYTGRSYGACAQYDVNKLRIYAGGKYHQNLLMEPRFNNKKLRYRFHGNSFVQKIGFNIGFNYRIPWNFSAIKPYVYYDLTYFRMDTRALILTEIDSLPNSVLVTPVKYSNLSSFENNVGIGFNGYFTSHISINMRGGIGANVISNLPEKEYNNGKYIGLSLQFVTGIQYDF